MQWDPARKSKSQEVYSLVWQNYWVVQSVGSNILQPEFKPYVTVLPKWVFTLVYQPVDYKRASDIYEIVGLTNETLAVIY